MDNKFVALMLEIEKRYQAPHTSFQKYEKIRIEQWVSRLLLIGLVQEALSSDSESAVEEEQKPLLHALAWPDP